MNLLTIKELNAKQITDLYKITDLLKQDSYSNLLTGMTFVLFFPQTSIRTRIAFEKGIKSLGGECILFPPETLDKKEELQDVVQYIENFAAAVIVRHKEYDKVEMLAKCSNIPIINAMTAYNHPCEIISDLYAISKIKTDYRELTYSFVGENANICRSWLNISTIMNLSFNHVCKTGYQFDYEDDHYTFLTDLESVLPKTDIVLTDSLREELKTEDYIKSYQITLDRMKLAKKGALLNPCPPFYRDEEVSSEVINSNYFVGYSFKENLLYVKQAIILYCLGIEIN
ncbi:ornithine carbamoyltransferase [Haloplasma contractile]|uniref:Ornithine carbamoyltransferase protein n=1 Tax=Haloplasma contractile SSD-17B TaxID=1033810 RepID=F7PTJ9_9MOLU|nr:ornithine carbamoyltransferase [Haloplasma contractile]ERJ12158.1 ornithine carbamoyltransferase protein [Haloplasma contractile SSD-17B]